MGDDLREGWGEGEWTLPPGFVVKVGGLPYTLVHETKVHGFRRPEHMQARPGTPDDDEMRRPDARARLESLGAPCNPSG